MAGCKRCALKGGKGKGKKKRKEKWKKWGSKSFFFFFFLSVRMFFHMRSGHFSNI